MDYKLSEYPDKKLPVQFGAMGVIISGLESGEYHTAIELHYSLNIDTHSDISNMVESIGKQHEDFKKYQEANMREFFIPNLLGKGMLSCFGLNKVYVSVRGREAISDLEERSKKDGSYEYIARFRPLRNEELDKIIELLNKV